MKLLQLPDCQPNEIGIDAGSQCILQSPSGLRRSCFSIAEFPNQGGGMIEAMSFITIDVVDERFVI
jgi:hypothetical protein